MQAMSTEMATLLKSGKMIGVNKPTAEVIIKDNASGETTYDWIDRKVLRGTYINGNWDGEWYGGSFVTRTDGKILVTYYNKGTKKVYLSFVDNEDDIFYSDNESVINEWEFYTTQTWPSSSGAVSRLQKLSNGKILLYIQEPGAYGVEDNEILVFESDNGLGTDFALKATIPIYIYASVSGVNGSLFTGQPIQLNSERILIPFVGLAVYSGDLHQCRGYVAYSDDNGVTWTVKTVYNNFYISETMKGIGVIGGNLYIACSGYTSNYYMRFYKSTDNGETWSALPSFSATTDYDGGWDGLYWGANGKTYWQKTTYRGSDVVQDIYEIDDTIILPDDVNIYSDENWNLIFPNSQHSYYDVIWVTEENNLAIAGVSTSAYKSARVWGANIIPAEKELQPKSIQISRQKGMAGQLTVEFDNKDGVLAPDGETNPQLLWPNKEVVVKQGYGAELIQTFKGLIDNIDMSTFPQSVSISVRDMTKVLLDHYVRDSSFNYVLTYTNQTIEDIWKDLITKSGLSYGTVGVTGITLTEKVFSWESYADAISWLEDIAGFEMYCDEFGVMHFIKDGLPESPTVAYEFYEGVDIVRLGYAINDKDLYYSVVVYGKASDDSVIYFAKQFPQAVYWNVPSGKIMRIDAPDADTSAKCQAIADKAIYLMQTRAREVSFQSIGIPHIQRGDFIRVVETSTTISEVYRVTSISTRQDAGGYLMDLTCYYHGEVVES